MSEIFSSLRCKKSFSRKRSGSGIPRGCFGYRVKIQPQTISISLLFQSLPLAMLTFLTYRIWNDAALSANSENNDYLRLL